MPYKIIFDSIKPLSSNKIKMLIIRYVQDVLLNNYKRTDLIKIAKKYVVTKVSNENDLYFLLKSLHSSFSNKYREETENDQNITSNFDYIYRVLNGRIDCKTFTMANLLILLNNASLIQDVELIFSGINDIQHVYLSILLNNNNNYTDIDICNKKFNVINPLKKEHNLIQTYQVNI